MAQLSDDCFSGPQALTALDEALQFFAQNLHPIVKAQSLPLSDCLNRFLAEDIIAPFSIPPHANSAVDGFLVYFDDLSDHEETRLPVIGYAKAGHPYQGTITHKQALRVLTGATLPDGPDTILMQEDCLIEGDHIVIPPGIRQGANLRQAGEDIQIGQIILKHHQFLRPQDIALAASVGRTSLSVYGNLRIAIFSTGDEIREPGDPIQPGQIYDSNRTLIRMCLKKWGVTCLDLGILPDKAAHIKQALMEVASKTDMIITTGGVSTGDEDHVRKVIQEIGQIHYWRLAIKPGRPIALGQIFNPSRSILFAGLPGNPVAAFVNLVHVVRPILFQLMGGLPHQHALPRFTAIADFTWKKKIGRREWLRVRQSGANHHGLPLLSRFPRDGAGILSSLTESDGLAEIMEHQEFIKPGDKIDYLPFWGMW